MKQSPYRTLLLWVIPVLLVVGIWTMVQKGDASKGVDFTQFEADIASGQVESVVVTPSDTTARFTYTIEGEDGAERRSTEGPVSDRVDQMLADSEIRVDYRREEESEFFASFLTVWLPLILIVVLFFFFMRQVQASGGRAMNFGKSRARLREESKNKITFKDVAGIDEAKDDCEEIIAFLQDPKKFQTLGGRIPKGVLLMGAPGTGKTLLARAIAGEARVPFFSISGSDFVEMFVGVGASRVRDLFEQGKRHAPCIIFIDEIDAVGRHRGSGMGGGHDEREQTLNQLLVEMDGFESTEGLIIIAATNRPDVLDPAILRPGRFDRRIVVPRPDLKGRAGILQVHTKRVRAADDVNLEVIARGTPGFSGADLENLVNEAALLAARQDKSQVHMIDFELAKDKVMMGAERRSMVISDREKRTTAFHEAGHALVGTLAEHTDPVHKVTIIPRGPALGITMSLPREERLSMSKERLLDQIAMMLGGRIAEEVVFGEKTTGASDDFKKATSLARSMVTEWGMSDKMGPLAYVVEEEQGFLGSSKQAQYSQEVAREIDDEVKRIILEQYAIAREMIEQNREMLDAIAEALLERETIGTPEIEAILEGRPLPPAERVHIPSYSEKRQKEKQDKKSSIFQPRPREVPS